MKFQILRVLVLLVSISAASVLVWNATRNKEPKETKEVLAVDPEEAFDPDDMQVSPKFGPVMSPDDIAEVVGEPIAPFVMDAEVKIMLDAMMSTSKSGKIISDDKIRVMLEEQKKEASEQKSDPPLMHSSKSFSGPIIALKDLEKIIEGKKQDPKAEQELPPQGE